MNYDFARPYLEFMVPASGAKNTIILLYALFPVMLSVPGLPTLTTTANARSVSIGITVPIILFTLQQYCVTIFRVLVSGVASTTPPATMCNSSSPITFSGLEEDSLYSIQGVAINTAGANGSTATGSFNTTATGKVC